MEKDEQMLTVAEVARRMRVTPWTVRSWYSNQGLPCHRLSTHSYRFYWSEVAAWLAERNGATMVGK